MDNIFANTDSRKSLVAVRKMVGEWKIGPLGMKWLKIVHLILVAFFLGGILSSYALNLKLNVTNYEETRAAYESMVIIIDEVVRYGAVGTLILAFIYGFFTTWGFFKHRWLTPPGCRTEAGSITRARTACGPPEAHRRG